MRSQLKHISLAGMLFFSAILMQGCSVLAWVGIMSLMWLFAVTLSSSPLNTRGWYRQRRDSRFLSSTLQWLPLSGIYAWLTGGRPCSDKQPTVT
jgi:hypothetical protein